MKVKRKFGHSELRVVAAFCGGAGLMVAIALLISTNALWGGSAAQQTAAVLEHDSGYVASGGFPSPNSCSDSFDSYNHRMIPGVVDCSAYGASGPRPPLAIIAGIFGAGTDSMRQSKQLFAALNPQYGTTYSYVGVLGPVAAGQPQSDWGCGETYADEDGAHNNDVYWGTGSVDGTACYDTKYAYNAAGWNFSLGSPIGGGVTVAPNTPVALEWSCQQTQRVFIAYCQASFFGCANTVTSSVNDSYSQSAGLSAVPATSEFAGTGGVQGSATVHPARTTTYTVSCGAYPSSTLYEFSYGSNKSFVQYTGIQNISPSAIPITITVDPGLSPIVNPDPPVISITGNGTNPTAVEVGDSVTIVGTYAASTGDTLTQTALNDSGNNALPGVAWTPPSNKTYTFTPSAPGTYVFYPAVQSTSYPTWNNYAKSLTLTVAPSSETASSSTTSTSSTTTSAAATLSLTANPTSVPGGGASTLTWSSQNTSDCTVSGPGVFVRALSGTQSTGPLSSQSTYTLTCVSASTNTVLTKTATVDVSTATCAGTPSSDCYFYADPTSVLRGGASTLHWRCPNSNTSSSGTNFSTGGALQGTASVSPTNTTDYSLTCNPSAIERHATVTVVNPTLSITANPLRVRNGNSTTVTWSAAGVTPGSCQVKANTASFATGDSGSKTSTITQSTMFTLTCSVPSSSLSVSATVDLIPSVIEK